jgi:membrane protease YdiL (CAAX protease family)
LPEWPTRWPLKSFKGIWTWALAAVIAAALVWLFVTSVHSGGASLKGLTPTLIVLGITVQFVLEGGLVALVLGVMPALSKFSLRELGFRRPDFGVLAFAALGAVAMVVVANGSATLIETLAHSKHEQDVVEIFKSLHNRTAIAFFALFAIVFAPFAEEVLFRIFFFNLGMRYGGFWCGAIVSGILFGIAHGDLIAALPLAMGGVVLCFVYYRTRNAWASMISHALFNALSIAALAFAPNLAS